MEQQIQALQGFLEHVRSKESEKDVGSGFAGEFLRLKRDSTKNRAEKTFPTKAADKQENVKKNRYKDIVPFDHSRVKLSFKLSNTDSDYINASFIQGAFNERAYIATQGPLPHTVLDFFRMIWEYNVLVIVMACREFELGRKKCERYWPEERGEVFVCDPFTVRCESEENKGDYITRLLTVTYANEARPIQQLHYMNWPDHGVPDSISSILEMIKEMRFYQQHEDIPICIHCSAGCGRTGALCAIDYTWNLMKNQMIPETFSVFQLVQGMRTQRPSVVQTKEQYELVYLTIKFLFEKHLQSMAGHNGAPEVTASPSPSSSESELVEIDKVLTREHPTAGLEMIGEPRTELGDVNLTLTEKQSEEQAWHQSLENWSYWRMDQSSALAHQRLVVDSLTALTLDTEVEPCLSEWPKPCPRPSLLQKKVCEEPQPPPSLHEEEEEDYGPDMAPLTPTSTANHEHMVEDPYFSSAEPLEELTNNSFSTSAAVEAQLSQNHGTDKPYVSWVEDVPPPLPERTPESYVMADNPENIPHMSAQCAGEDLLLNLPDDLIGDLSQDLLGGPAGALFHAVLEGSAFGRVLSPDPAHSVPGSPPSPAPPLPERTAESFILATEEDLNATVLQAEPKVNIRVGSSKEWSTQEEHTKSRSRSKGHPVVPHLLCPQPQINLLLLLFCLFPSLPARQKAVRVSRPLFLSALLSPSCWLFPVSVRTRGSKKELVPVAAPAVPNNTAATPQGNGAAQHPIANTEAPEGAAAPAAAERQKAPVSSKRMSLKILKHKRKSRDNPSGSVFHPALVPACTNTQAFKFSFGTRFGKPKGPRESPQSWS